MSRDNEFWLWRALKDAFRRSSSPDKPLDVEFFVPVEREPIENATVAPTPFPSPRRDRRPILNRLATAETPAPSVDAAIALRKFLTRKQNEAQTVRRLALLNRYNRRCKQDENGRWHFSLSLNFCAASPPVVEPFESSKFPYRKLYSEQKDLRFFFEADCPPSSPRYWLAELAIPPFASDLTVLRLKVTDAAGRPLDLVCRSAFGPKPYFAIGSQGYQIQDGLTPLTLSVFQNYFIKQTQLGVLFNDRLSPGSLRLLDADAVAQTRAARS